MMEKHSPSQSQPSGETRPVARPAPMICDLCSAPFLLAPEVIIQGRVHGLLTCSQCVEDALASRQLETAQ